MPCFAPAPSDVARRLHLAHCPSPNPTPHSKHATTFFSPYPPNTHTHAHATSLAQPDLVEWLARHADDAGPLPGKKRLFRAARHEARGILEGLAYFGLA